MPVRSRSPAPERKASSEASFRARLIPAQLLAWSGLRCGEATALRRKDIDP
jgi:integrase